MSQRSGELVFGLGDNEVAVIFREKEIARILVTVNKKEVTSVEIKSGPTKTEYIEGETFNPEGLTLTITYNNGTSEDIEYNESTKEYFTIANKTLSKEDRKIVIGYADKEVEVEIKVTAKPVIEGPTDANHSNNTDKSKVDLVNTGDTNKIEEYFALAGLSLVLLDMKRKVAEKRIKR